MGLWSITMYWHSAFQSVKGIRAREPGQPWYLFISYPPSPLAASSVHLVPMFLYWHMSRFLKVFLKVALQTCIASGVDGAVDVAEPVANGPDCVWNARLAERVIKTITLYGVHVIIKGQRMARLFLSLSSLVRHLPFPLHLAAGADASKLAATLRGRFTGMERLSPVLFVGRSQWLWCTRLLLVGDYLDLDHWIESWL